MSVLGISPLGTGLGPMGGPGLITVKGVIPISANQCVVVCDRVPLCLNNGAYDDATQLDHWSMTAIDPTVYPIDLPPYIPLGKYKARFIPTVVSVELDDEDDMQLILGVDVKFEARVEYQLTIEYLEGLNGETFAGTTVFTFDGLIPPKRYRRIAVLGPRGDPYTDFANGFVSQDGDTPVPVGLITDGGGNFRRVTGVASTHQRLRRRILTVRDSFLVLRPGYGTAYPTGQLARATTVQALVNAIAQGARAEPDVLASECLAQIAPGGEINITLRVRTVDNSQLEVQQAIQL